MTISIAALLSAIRSDAEPPCQRAHRALGGMGPRRNARPAQHPRGQAAEAGGPLLDHRLVASRDTRLTCCGHGARRFRRLSLPPSLSCRTVLPLHVPLFKLNFPFLMHSLPQLDDAPTRTVLQFMSLETGGAQPLAWEADLQLDTDLPVNFLDVRADVIGEQIVLVLVDLRTEDPESDVIYLVDWKQGCMTLVSHMNVHMACRPLHTQHIQGAPRPKWDVRGRARGALARPRALSQARRAVNRTGT